MAKKDDKEKNKSPDSRPSKAGALKGARGNKGSSGDPAAVGSDAYFAPRNLSGGPSKIGRTGMDDSNSPAVGSDAYFAPRSLSGGPSNIGRTGMDDSSSPAVGSSDYFAPRSLSDGPSNIGRTGMDDSNSPAVGSSDYFAPRSLSGGPSNIGRTGMGDTTTFSSSVTTDPTTTSSNIPDPTGASGPIGAIGKAGTVGQPTTQTTAPTTTQTTAPTTTQTTAPTTTPAEPPTEPPADGSTTTATAKTEPPQSFFDYLPTKGKDGFSALPAATTQEEAIERVKYFQETGQGLKGLAARQDPKFKEAFNEGKPTSPLLEDSKPLEGVERRKANQIEREARRIKDPAVRRALLLQAAQIRAGQPNITTPATKKAELDRNMQKREVLKDTLEAGQKAAGSSGSSGARGSKGTVGRTEEDDELLGMTGGTSTYRPIAFTPVEVILREARSRRT